MNLRSSTDRLTSSAARNVQQPSISNKNVPGLSERRMHEGQETRMEVPSPPGGRLLSLPGRHPLLPVVYEVNEHPLVQKPHGKIYIGILDLARKAMEKLFVAAANMDLPNNRKQLKSKGTSF